jgi:protein-tyrosine phosphatase
MPSLIHCAHGKDRTGVVIMLLLLICDTPHEAIVQDYIQVRVCGWGGGVTVRPVQLCFMLAPLSVL